MASRILLIRHGETDANAARVVQRPDVPLSEVGIAQARRLAERLASEGLGAILSSDLQRAVTTAEHLRASTGAPLRLEPLLQERNYGDIRGRTYSSLPVSILDPEYHPPGGESWQEFHARVDRAWEAVLHAAAELPADRALGVVTHGLVLYSLVSRHLSPGDSYAAAFANTSVTICEPGPPPRWRLALLNCVAHLEGDAADSAPA